MSEFRPVYLETFEKGILAQKIEVAYKRLKSCTLCPRKCKVDRLSGETGVCKTADKAYVSSYNPHFGEEAPLVGRKGSGTIFFTHCNLMCNFCQNYDISHEGHGEEVSNDTLAQMMIALQNTGCHNINFVTPSHVVSQILAALEIAIREGLRVPLVYNTGAYDRVSTLKLLEGVFDIYMPDFKFWAPEVSRRTCDAPDYSEVARKALIEMHRQVGDLVMDSSGIAQRGLLIRHLVLPNALAGTREVMRFIAKELSPNSYVNIMSQYRPCGRASEIKELAVPISSKEYETAVEEAKKEGITRLDRPRRVFVLW
ncbi:MAG: radical SAM protein [Deltaproteobacteria bacterium]|nr:radical SAM protein [Deltaproteobacteria bacterium]MBW1962256.1 radical SAM protein [Deltaproteobacteria bacterium]MBW1992953.1 radical SAM protein [Deltaproteobacteria bacterium]MBW2150980.1 radical SAM protein [Deltaproteobacteria bacterium]